MIRGNKDDVEAEANKTKLETNKCSIYIQKFTLVFFILTIFMGYFMTLSTNSNVMRNIHYFDTVNVTNPPLKGDFFF